VDYFLCDGKPLGLGNCSYSLAIDENVTTSERTVQLVLVWWVLTYLLTSSHAATLDLCEC